jgi:ParB family chromosome partitioning protein
MDEEGLIMSFKDDLLSQGNIKDVLARKREENKDKPPTASNLSFSTAPGRMAEQQDRKALLKQIEDLRAELARSKSSASSFLPLDQLHEVPNRRRKLTDAQYAELKENLRNNETTTPITVIVRPEGGYEIVSGHNRVAIYRELGRETIPAYVRTGEGDAQFAKVNAFYANLLQFGLSDWEKYEGFRMIQDNFPERTQAEIAAESGQSASFVSQIMTFGDLPAAAQEIIKNAPGCIGANAAQDLAKLTKEGRADQVVSAIQALAEGKIDQQRAVRQAAADAKPKTEATKPQPEKVKIGRTTYCGIRQAKNLLRLEFQSEEEAAAAKDAVRLALETLAQKKAEEMKATDGKQD